MVVKLKELRKQRKLNQQPVANVINCSQAVYSRYENGDREPPLDALIRLADFYDVSLDELVGRVPMPVEVIHADPPPLQEGEIELVIEPNEKAPSGKELERMVLDMVAKELKKRGL